MLLLLAVSLFQTISYAQAPNGINYQAVIRNSTGALSSNTPVAIRVNIRQTTTTGTIVYSERQNVTTDQFGLVNFVIGTGTFLSGSPFANINWGNGPYFLDLGVAFSGLPNPAIYMPYGTQQMMSVPYALYAKSSGNLVNQWKYGAGVPASNLGLVGDYYLDTATGNVYNKTNSTTWVLITNITGPQGVAGAQGLQGIAGPIGPIGATGATGPQGPVGLTGPAGVAGLTGAAGPQGNQGIAGPAGPTGLTGAAGVAGPQGIQGLPGTNGAAGATGAAGPQGPSGAVGATGLQGPAGVAGPQGVAGTNGINGTNGLNALVKTTLEPAGANCATGGTKVETGLDANNNGVLDLAEINAAQTTYVCNGSAGTQGIQGIAGSAGASGLLSSGNAAGNTPYWDGSQWVVNNSNVFNNGAEVGIGTVNPNTSAKVDIESTTQGFLLPRMTTTQRNAIASPALGLQIFNSTTNCLNFYTGTSWFETCGSPSSTSILANLNCGGATITSTLTNGTAASGVSVSVPYTGGNAGVYSAQSVSSTGVVNVTASLAAGTLANGAGSLTYTITGTPTTSGTASFSIVVGGQSCTFTVPVSSAPVYAPIAVNCAAGATAIVNVTNPLTGKIWMDRNLGSITAGSFSTDQNAYGNLYQWGRFTDGHQCRFVPTTATLSNIDQPAHGNFITSTTGNYDWRSPQNTNLWQGVNGINNPCPSAYRVPTEAEFVAECSSWGAANNLGAFGSPLRWTLGGRRYPSGTMNDVGTVGYYWSSTAVGTQSKSMRTDGSQNVSERGFGFSLRCIKD